MVEFFVSIIVNNEVPLRAQRIEKFVEKLIFQQTPQVDHTEVLYSSCTLVLYA